VNNIERFCHITCRNISKLFYCSLSHAFLLFFLHDATRYLAETPGNEAELT